MQRYVSGEYYHSTFYNILQDWNVHQYFCETLNIDNCLYILFPHDATAPSGPGLLIIEASRSHSVT